MLRFSRAQFERESRVAFRRALCELRLQSYL